MASFLVTPAAGAAIVLTNSLVYKAYMILAHRSKLQGKSAEETKKYIDSPAFKNDHAAQLNDAEWSSLILSALLFLAAKGYRAPITATVCTFGALWCACRDIAPGLRANTPLPVSRPRQTPSRASSSAARGARFPFPAFSRASSASACPFTQSPSRSERAPAVFDLK